MNSKAVATCDGCGLQYSRLAYIQKRHNCPSKTGDAIKIGRPYGYKILIPSFPAGCQHEDCIKRKHGVIFYKEQQYRRHYKRHFVKLSCRICGKTTVSQQEMTSHERTHANTAFQAPDTPALQEGT